MTSYHKSTPNFKIEGLEARILLSAVPIDGEVADIDEPIFADSVLVLDSSEDASIAGAVNPSSAASSAGDLYTDAAPLHPVDEIFLSGQLEAGLLVQADIIHVADGTVLDGVQLSAGSIRLGAAEWVGDNTVLADDISILATQSATEGATLVLAPRTVEATIALGFDDAGFALDSEEMAALAVAGLENLVIGLADGAHDITIDGLAYEGNILMRSPEDGGEFYILSQIAHSGGVLSYHGSGQTQNTSADTITSGNEILVNDSLNLVYVENNGNAFGDNTIYFDTTNGGANPEGSNISISGDILGTEFGNGGTLYLNAGTTGDILIQGGVGTLEALGRIVIVNAHDATFEGDIILESFQQQSGTGSSSFGATASNFVLTGGGDFIVETTNHVTFGGDVESASQNFEITVDPSVTSGKVWFKGDVNVDDGDLIVHSAKDFEMTGSVEIAGALLQSVGTNESIFRGSVQANTIDLHTQQRIRFLDTVTLLEGDMVLVANEIDFEGGAGSIIGALDSNGIGISRLFLRPTAASVSMDIGDPAGGVGLFELSAVDIAALADGFALITVGYHQTATTSTNAVRIGSASFLDALEVYGGSFLVNGSFNARTSLLVEADSGTIEITGTQVSVINEQVDDVWQSSELTLLAHVGNIEFGNGALLLIDNNNIADTAEGSTIHLIATDGSIINEANSFGFIEARDLNIVAGQSITVLTDVETVSAHSTGVGDIQIDEFGELHVIRGITANGAIVVSTAGDTVVDLLESETDASANNIEVEVFGGDLNVDKILAGTQGSVQLEIEGEIRGFSQSDRSSLLNLPLILISGGNDAAQAATEWTLQGVTISLNTTLFTDAFNGSTFRLVASEEPSLTPVRVESDDGVYTLYALPSEATHADVVAAIDGLGDFDASITAGSSSLLALPAITLASGTDAPLVAASGSYDFGSTLMNVSAQTSGVGANGTRIIFAADAVGVSSADWDGTAKVLTLHYVSGVTSVAGLQNLINSTTDANLSAALGSGDGTQILGIESATVIDGATASTAEGAFAFAEGVLTVTGDTSGSAPNGGEIYFVGDADAGDSAGWHAGDGILTIRYTAGVSTLGDLAAAVSGAGAGITANVTSGNSLAVLDIPATELNGGREGVPASGNLMVDGVNLRLSDTTGTVTNSGPTFRLVAALVDSDAVSLTALEPVRILSVGNDFTIYALAGIATHADVLSAITALSDFEAAIVDAHLVGDVLALNAQTGLGEALNPLQISANQVSATNTDSGSVRLQQDDNRAAVEVAINNQSVIVGDLVAFTLLGGNATIIASGIQSDSAAEVLVDVAGSLTVDGDINSGGGDILLASSDSLIAAGSIVTSGAGRIVLIGDSLTIQAAIYSSGGALSLAATNEFVLDEAADVETNGAGEILVISDNGSILAAAGSTVTAVNGSILFSAASNITLGAVSTQGDLGLEATSGSILAAPGGVTTRLVLTADNLAIVSGDSIAGANGTTDALLIDVNTLSLSGGTGAVYNLSNDGTLLVDTTSASVTRYNSLLAATTVSINAQSTLSVIGEGATTVTVTNGGDLNVGADITSVSGTLTLNISGSGSLDATMLTGGDISISSGSAWIMTGSSSVSGALVSIDSGADLTLGNVSGTSVDIDSGAELLSATGSTRNISATTAASIIAHDGIGGSGSNYNISVEAPVLTVENLTAGSAYLLLFGTTRIDQLDLNNSGTLQLNLSGGDLDLAGGIALGTGSAVVRVNGALALGDRITGNGDIQLTAQSLNIDTAFSLVNPLIESLERSIELRVSGDASFPAGAILRAALGDIKMTVGGELTLPVVFAGGLISIRGNGTVLAAGIGNENHLLTAEAIQLLAGANLGNSAQPIVTQATRLDAQASSAADVVELDDLEIGRYGLRLKDATTSDTFVLLLDEATGSSLSSVNGAVNVDGNFILRSNGTVTLQTRLINTDGNLFLEVAGLQFALAGAEPVFVASDGLLDLEVGAAGIGAGLSLTAAQLTALVESGDFTALIHGSSEVTTDGIVLTDSTGKATLTVDNGNLTLGGAVIGAGGIQLEILDGGLTTTEAIADIPVLVAGDQVIQLELGSGASGAGGDAIVTASLEFSAITDSGDLNFEFRPSGNQVITKLVDQGLTIRSGGVGNISLLVSGHNLDLHGNVEHAGLGSVTLDVASGGVDMYVGSSILVNSGTLNLSSNDFLIINYIENLQGSSYINCTVGPIVRNAASGTSFVNLRGSIRPVITLSDLINLRLDVDEATVNGILHERVEGDDYLHISGTYP